MVVREVFYLHNGVHRSILLAQWWPQKCLTCTMVATEMSCLHNGIHRNVLLAQCWPHNCLTCTMMATEVSYSHNGVFRSASLAQLWPQKTTLLTQYWPQGVYHTQCFAYTKMATYSCWAQSWPIFNGVFCTMQFVPIFQQVNILHASKIGEFLNGCSHFIQKKRAENNSCKRFQ